MVPGMTATTPGDDPLEVLGEQFDWYRSHAKSSGQRYRVLEVTLLVVAASVPVSAVVSDSWVTAALGAVVVVLTGLRSIFSWQEDWLRFTEAWQQLQFARTLYVNRLPPYDDDANRVSRLVLRVQEIQAAETRGWLSLRAEDRRRPATSEPPVTPPPTPAPSPPPSSLP
jgi:hypothetical protein